MFEIYGCWSLLCSICGWICDACCVFRVLKCISILVSYIATNVGLWGSNVTETLGDVFQYINYAFFSSQERGLEAGRERWDVNNQAGVA